MKSGRVRDDRAGGRIPAGPVCLLTRNHRFNGTFSDEVSITPGTG